MANLDNRIARLEMIGLSADKGESIRAYCTRVQKSWSALVLEGYRDGRLDELAADRTIPAALLLDSLSLSGHAVLIGSHWVPLFLGDDDATNERVAERFEAERKPHWDTEIRALKNQAAMRAAT